jgi:glycosyltransferase involved in cell wall biosynthesis
VTSSINRFESVLVLADAVPSGRVDLEDRRLSQLVATLRGSWPGIELTIAALEVDPRDPAIAWARGLGIRIATAPTPWESWFRAERFRHSLIIASGRGATARLLPRAKRSNPQALVIVDVPSLGLDELDGFSDSFAHGEERRGAELARREHVEAVARTIEAVDAYLVAAFTDLPPALPIAKTVTFGGRSMAPLPTNLHDRSGVLVVASMSRLHGDPDEHLVVDACDTIARLEGGSSTRVRVVVDDPWPTFKPEPGSNVSVVPLADLRAELHRARVLFAARRFGPTPTWLTILAAEHGAPVVTSLAHARHQTAQLLAADGHWRETVAAQLAALPSPADDIASLASLLASVGFVPPVATSDGPSLVPGVRGSAGVDPTTFQGQVQTRGWDEFRPFDRLFLLHHAPPPTMRPDVAYEWWQGAHPLTAEMQSELRAAGAALKIQPKISVLMPVFDTDPDVLRAAVNSVRAQLYRRWELCIVDDGSTRAETITALAELAAQDPRIRVTRLAENAGIARASNAALAMAVGEFIALVDHDDELTPEALFEVVRVLNTHPDTDFMYSDEDKMDGAGELSAPFFKPSWSPDFHLSVNYVTHFAVYRRSVVDSVGGFREGFDGSQDYDLALRVTEVTHRVAHVAKPMYHWRMVEGSAATAHDAKPYALDAANRALNEAVGRRWPGGRVQPGRESGTWRARYPLLGDPLVSIVIPTRNGADLLTRCVEAVRRRTEYRNYEIVVVDNGSDDADALEAIDALADRVVRYPYRFNFARQMNLAAANASGDILLLLNNDVEMDDPGWLEAMVEHAQRPEVGAVGARLLFPGGRVQHEGVFVGYGGGAAGNIDFGDYMRLGRMIRNCTAVTAACLAIRPEVLRAIGGFDERLRVAFNDVDLCLRIRQRGYRIVYTPYAELRHAESASRGKLHPMEDEAFFVSRWGGEDDLDDPFYNPNLDFKLPFQLRR